MPIFLECQRCTACCRWPGQVLLDAGEIARLASHLEVTEHDFIQSRTRLSDDRRGLALAEKANGECILLDGNQCTVQPVKPQQCRDFPNLWNFPGFREHCRAVPREVDPAAWQHLIERATGRQNHPIPSSNTGGAGT